MSISQLILDTLKPLNVPVAFLKYKGKENTYIIFQEYLQQGEGFSEDMEEITGHYIQLNIFSKGNYNSLVKKVKELLGNAGFKRLNENDLYENDTELRNHIIRFYYSEEVS